MDEAIGECGVHALMRGPSSVASTEVSHSMSRLAGWLAGILAGRLAAVPPAGKTDGSREDHLIAGKSSPPPFFFPQIIFPVPPFPADATGGSREDYFGEEEVALRIMPHAKWVQAGQPQVALRIVLASHACRGRVVAAIGSRLSTLF